MWYVETGGFVIHGSGSDKITEGIIYGILIFLATGGRCGG